MPKPILQTLLCVILPVAAISALSPLLVLHAQQAPPCIRTVLAVEGGQAVTVPLTPYVTYAVSAAIGTPGIAPASQTAGIGSVSVTLCSGLSVNVTLTPDVVAAVTAAATSAQLPTSQPASPASLPATLPTSQPETAPAQPTTLPTPNPTPSSPHSLFGVNLEEMIPWGRSRPFIDLVKTSPGFDTLAHPGDHAAPIGADGWPTSDFGVILAQGAPTTWSGVYTIVFSGKVSLSVSNGSKLGASSYNATTNTTVASLSWNAATDSLSVFCRSTTAPRHIQVLRPGYTAGQAADQVFSGEFLTMLKTLSPGIVRGMDALETNNTRVINWSDRSTLAAPSYNSTARPLAPGMPYELLISLCNTLGADLWLNVPATASSDYVNALAALVAAQLSPGLYVYLEYGNEVWNSGLGSYAPNMAAAAAQTAAMGFDSDSTIAGWQRTAVQCQQIGQTFASALQLNNPTTPLQRVRPVLCGQGSNLATLQAGWQYLQAHGGTAGIWGMGVAPYAPLVPTLTQSDWRVQLLAGPHVVAFEQLCQSYGVKSCCYECGCDLTGSGISTATQTDSRMQQVLGWYYAAWQGTGPLMHYNVCGETSTAFGLTNDATALTAPKFLAAVAYAAKKASN